MTFNLRCEICDLAYEMGKSEEQFYQQFGKLEREQLLATYRSQRHRNNVAVMFPLKAK